jgi:hypothetical protein
MASISFDPKLIRRQEGFFRGLLAVTQIQEVERLVIIRMVESS